MEKRKEGKKDERKSYLHVLIAEGSTEGRKVGKRDGRKEGRKESRKVGR